MATMMSIEYDRKFAVPTGTLLSGEINTGAVSENGDKILYSCGARAGK
jgi:hypothetical protein